MWMVTERPISFNFLELLQKYCQSRNDWKTYTTSIYKQQKTIWSPSEQRSNVLYLAVYYTLCLIVPAVYQGYSRPIMPIKWAVRAQASPVFIVRCTKLRHYTLFEIIRLTHSVEAWRKIRSRTCSLLTSAGWVYVCPNCTTVPAC